MFSDASDLPDGPRADAESRQPDDADLLRLLVGGGLEAGDRLRRLLASTPSVPGDAEAATGDAAPLEVRAERVMLGLLFVAYGRAARSLSMTSRLVEGALDLGASLLRPLRQSSVLAPVLWPFEAGAGLGLSMLQRLERIGVAEASRSREVARSAAGRPVAQILEHLQNSPEMQALVLQQAHELLAELRQSPEVDALVQTQTDRTVAHLREHPEAVQELVAGQSLGLADELMNTLRHRTYKLDAMVERVLRRLLGRTPREQLPLPEPAVRFRAEHPYDSAEDWM